MAPWDLTTYIRYFTTHDNLELKTEMFLWVRGVRILRHILREGMGGEGRGSWCDQSWAVLCHVKKVLDLDG